MIPVKHSREGKHAVFRAGVRGVAHEGVHPGFVEGEPGGVEVGDHGSGVDEVAVVEMVVVVIRVTKVLAGVACDVGS